MLDYHEVANIFKKLNKGYAMPGAYKNRILLANARGLNGLNGVFVQNLVMEQNQDTEIVIA